MEDISPLYGILFVVSMWSLAWKGMALWQAAHRKTKNWFIVLLVLNTAGILELVYLFRVQRKPLYLWMIGVAIALLFIMFISLEPMLQNGPNMF